VRTRCSSESRIGACHAARIGPVLCGPRERSPSGLWRRTGNAVRGNPSRVRIPPSPPSPCRSSRAPAVRRFLPCAHPTEHQDQMTRRFRALCFGEALNKGPAGRKPTPRLTLVPRWTTTRQECQRRSPGRRRFSAQARQASVRQPGRRPGMRAKRGIAPAFGGRSIKRALAGFPPPNARFAGARRNVPRSAARRRGRSPAPAPGTDPRPADRPSAGRTPIAAPRDPR
jgi:hypothetical protein